MTSLAGTGFDGILQAIARVGERHPDHCDTCRQARIQTERELRALQDGRGLPPRPLFLSFEESPVRAAALEVVETYRGATAPALRSVVRHLHIALQARGR